MAHTRDYEITYTLDPSLEDAKREEVTATIDRKIDELQGVISSNSDTTRRKLAYPIHKQRMGFMRLIQAQLEPGKIAPLRHDIARLPGVLRLAIIQSAARPDVTSSIFDPINKQQTPEAKPAAVAKKPAKQMSDQEVEAKIEEALDEEVK